jgi:hypothetical protein
MNNNIVLYSYFNFLKNKFNITNRVYLYDKGYFLLWDYTRIPNFFEKNSLLWVYEEGRRQRSIRYFFIIQNPYILNSKEWLAEDKIRKLDLLKKISSDLRSFSFLIFYLHCYVDKLNQNSTVIYTSLFDLFQKEFSYVFSKKEYKDFFLKAKPDLLNKFDDLKKFLSLNRMAFVENFSMASVDNRYQIFNMDNEVTADIFPYLYLQTMNFFDLNKLYGSINYIRTFFFISLQKIKGFYYSIRNGLQDFYLFSFLRILSFYFIDILKDSFISKRPLQSSFIIKISKWFSSLEKNFIISRNKQVNLSNLSYLDEYFFFDYFINKHVRLDYLVDEDIYSDNLFQKRYALSKAMMHYSSSFTYNGLDYSLFRPFFDSEDFYFKNLRVINNLFLNILRDYRSFSLNAFFFFFKLYDTSKKTNNIFLKYYFLNIMELPEIFFSIHKFNSYGLSDLYKNIDYNSSSVRSYFISKVITVLGQGLISKYRSILSFFKKYFYAFYFLTSLNVYDFSNLNLLFESVFFKKTVNVISDYLFYKGSFNKVWFFLPSGVNLNFFKINYINSYLNLKQTPSIFSGLPSAAIFDVKYYKRKRDSRIKSYFYKYNILLFNSLKKSSNDLFLYDSVSNYNKYLCFFKMVNSLSRIKRVLDELTVKEKNLSENSIL